MCVGKKKARECCNRIKMKSGRLRDNTHFGSSEIFWDFQLSRAGEMLKGMEAKKPLNVMEELNENEFLCGLLEKGRQGG
jgi:hypothetical protein